MRVRYKILIFIIAASISSASFLFFASEKDIVIGGNSTVAAKVLRKERGTSAKPESRKKASIIFGGDVMLDRYVRQVGETKGYGYILEGIKKELIGSEAVVANLEGPMTENDSVSLGSEFGSRDNYIFTFNPETAGFLKEHNIRIVNIGNNHIDNFGQAGIASTIESVEKSDIGYFGDFRIRESGNHALKDFDGTKIAFVGYNQFVANSREVALKDVGDARSTADFVVVYAHWGKEYESGAREKEMFLAHEFVDKGADLVVGSHPHVIQNKESYKGKMIYYSLGNFIFDQYFSEAVTQGLLVKAIFDKNKKEIRLEECRIRMLNSGKVVIDDRDSKCFDQI